MTCFWDGIISSLNNDDLKILGLNSRPTPNILAEQLKKRNTKTISILWENKPLSCNELEENHIHITDYTSASVHQGYLCSICDPFLCLLCELLKVNIKHTYLNNTVHYTNPHSVRTFSFRSNRGHFWRQ